jgi:hypothetical protein
VPVGGVDEDEFEDEFAENSSGSDSPKGQKMPILSGFWRGGAEGGRTPDLLIANEALSQLSYGPAKIQLRRKSLRVGAI